jgi:hypothetical protein
LTESDSISKIGVETQPPSSLKNALQRALSLRTAVAEVSVIMIADVTLKRRLKAT